VFDQDHVCRRKDQKSWAVENPEALKGRKGALIGAAAGGAAGTRPLKFRQLRLPNAGSVVGRAVVTFDQLFLDA